jgi:hypothetical protein
MTVGTYQDLLIAVSDYLSRPEVSARIPDFIAQFEAHANTELAGHRRAEATTSLTTSSGSAALPADFSMQRAVWYNATPPIVLQYTEPNYFYGRWGDRATGTPVAFTIIGSNLLVGPVSDSTSYTLDYSTRLTGLSSSNTTNWLLTYHPNAYIFGALTEACSFLGDPRLQAWIARRDDIINAIKRHDAMTRTPSRPRIDGPVV